YNSYTLNSISMAAGTESVKDVKYFKSTVSKVISTRTEVSDKLRGLGFKVMDSQTNFLFATHPQKNMKDYFEWLKAQKIYIRHFNLPRIKNYVRITIGTNSEMDIFLKKTKEYLNK
ncbi:MAG: aminotransferase class I/II-fold pyridoxal phosphate-dependent enzyme, partial [Clostridiales bacterium]|nr:aminotransferase class I/II-fold pyridoxal phosphate-dependent enzyme [Clostridiales bacterium]